MKLSFFLAAYFGCCALAHAEETISHDEETISHEEESIDHGEETISHDEETIDHSEGKTKPVAEEESFEIEADLIGKFSSTAQFDTQFDKEGEDIVEWTQRLDLRMDIRTSPTWRFVLSGEMMHWTGAKENKELVNLYINAAQVRTQFDVQLGESFAQYQKGKWNVRVGNLISRWGSTDISRPSDIINPVDRTRAITGDASLRIPQMAVDAKYVFESLTAQVLIVPFFVPDRSFTFGRDSSLLAADIPALSNFPVSSLLQGVVDNSTEEYLQSALVASERPDEDPSNISIGGRLSTTFWNTDLSIGYFFGWDRTASIYLDEDVRALGGLVFQDGAFLQDLDFVKFLGRNEGALDRFTEVRKKIENNERLVESKFSRLHMLSLDGARYFGEFGLRFEVAAHPEKTFITESFETLRRPFINSAVGLSYEKIESEDDAFTIIVEGFYSEVGASDSSLTDFFVAQEDRGADDALLIFGERNYGLITSVVWELPWLDMQAQAAGRMDFSRKDVLVAGSVEYRWTPRFKSSLGATFFEHYGDTFSVGKAFDHNDFVWLKTEAIF